IPVVLKQAADVAICSEVLEHLDKPLLFLQNASRLFKKNGKLIVTVPDGYRSAYDHHIGHRRHFKSKEIKQLLEKAGFEVDIILTAGFPFFNLYKLLVILRGKKLIMDIKQKTLSYGARCMMFIFYWLFKMNVSWSPWGWQLIVVASFQGKKK